MEKPSDRKGLLAWFASNHVAANLLMLLIVAAGLLSIFTAKMEVFPEFSLDMINVSIPYLGASPDDVEQGVCVRVEEAIAGVEGIKRMTSTASEGGGSTLQGNCRFRYGKLANGRSRASGWAEGDHSLG